jgi:lysophospholipase L1-like esterase
MKVIRIITLLLSLALVNNLWAQIKIMPMGDSITKGEFGSTDDTGYRRLLYHLLEDSGYDVNFVGSLTSGIPLDFDRDHEGHNGYKINELEANTYLTDNPAHIVLLHIGTNDIRKDPSYTTSGEVEALLDEIDLWETVNNRSAIVILAEIINTQGHVCPDSSTTTTFNNNVKAMAEARTNDRIVLVDMECSADLNYFTDIADDVHPNDAGFEKMAEKWFADGLLMILPQANAGSDQSVSEGTLVTLDGSWSIDPDGSEGFPLDYFWEQESGTSVNLSSLTDENPTFTAPAVGAGGDTLSFKLTVTDADGFEHADSVSVFINSVFVQPIADAGTDQSVEAGNLVKLDGSNSRDPDGTISLVQWQQINGTSQVALTAPNELITAFTAPAVDFDGDELTFKLTITDNDGIPNEDTVNVTIMPPRVSEAAKDGGGSGGGGCFIQAVMN